MTRSNVVAVISFAVVFAAGVFVGQLGWGGAHGSGSRHDSSLTSQLDLTPTQRQAVRQIWNEELEQTTRAAAKRWEDAETARDAAVRSLLTPDQLKAYDKIEASHRERAIKFRSELLQMQLDAEAKTRSQLSPQQREKFDKLVTERGPIHASAPTLPLGMPVGDVRAVPATMPKDAQAR
jgi:Spy/CpxP family protein refolding chaperone